MKTAVCKKHGEFTEEEAYIRYDKRYIDGYLLRCKKCAKEDSLKSSLKARTPQLNTATHCHIHGDLNEDNGYLCNENGRIRFRCKACAAVKRKKQYADNREEAIKSAGEWKKAHRARVNEQVKQDKKQNPEKYKKWNDAYYSNNRKKISVRKTGYALGFKYEDYVEMENHQDKKCGICGKEETRKARNGDICRLCVDHDHDTGKLRMLLCHDCNSGLGKFYDSPDLLMQAAFYLIEHGKECVFLEDK